MAGTTPVLSPQLGPDCCDVVWVDGNDAALPGGQTEYAIAEFAALFGLTHRALRFYESRGMIAPRRVGRNRVYGRAERDRLALIVKGKKLGFTLAEIAQMIEIQEGRASALTLRLTHEACAAQIKFFEQQMISMSEALVELRRIQASLGAGSFQTSSAAVGRHPENQPDAPVARPWL